MRSRSDRRGVRTARKPGKLLDPAKVRAAIDLLAPATPRPADGGEQTGASA